MASIESIFMYLVAHLPKISIFTSYKEIGTADSAGYNGTEDTGAAFTDSMAEPSAFRAEK